MLQIIKIQKLLSSSMMQKNFALSSKQPLVNYDALQDKHASFYFNGYGVKKHLKKLRKAIQKQPFQKGNKEYAEMLTHKLSQLQKSNDDMHRKTKPYIQTLKESSLQKLHKGNHSTSNANSRNFLTHDQQNYQKKANVTFQNLPNISKYKVAEPKKLFGLQNENSEDKTNKSLSLMGKWTIPAQRKDQAAHLIKQRSNKSVQGFSKLKKNASSKQDKIVEVKHQDFMSFLKKRQEDILKVSKAITPTHKPSLIKEEAYVNDQS